MSTEIKVKTVHCKICNKIFAVQSFHTHFKDCHKRHSLQQSQSPNKLLHRLDFDKAHYNGKSGGIFIPFNLKLPELYLHTYLYISCSEEYHKPILFALKDEMRFANGA